MESYLPVSKINDFLFYIFIPFISYDFEDNRKRARFAKFLKKFGRKIQYSVYEIKNSPRVLQNILSEIELKYKKDFSGSDSILIFLYL